MFKWSHSKNSCGFSDVDLHRIIIKAKDILTENKKNKKIVEKKISGPYISFVPDTCVKNDLLNQCKKLGVLKKI